MFSSFAYVFHLEIVLYLISASGVTESSLFSVSN